MTKLLYSVMKNHHRSKISICPPRVYYMLCISQLGMYSLLHLPFLLSLTLQIFSPSFLLLLCFPRKNLDIDISIIIGQSKGVGKRRLKADRRDEETWLTALDQSMGMPTKKVNKYSLFQYSILQIILIALTGIALVIFRALLSHQRWVWLLGTTLLAELAIRLVVEVVWRKLRLGGILQRWLKRLAQKVNGILLNID